MAVVEYMLHNIDGDHRRQVPGFIGDRGHWYNPANHTYIGWISENRDFYVPDSVKRLTKEDFVQRQLLMHQNNKMVKPDPNFPASVNMGVGIEMTEQEVRESVEIWYDNFVNDNVNK